MVFNVTFEEIFGAGGGIFQEKTVMPGAQEQEVKPDEGCDALSKVTVAGDEDLIAANIRKNVEIFGVTGTCEAAGILQAKVARSSSSDQDVEADAGYAGLSKVTVQGDTNLVASNIKKDVEILGVVGTHEGLKDEQETTVRPTASGRVILPDADKVFSKVTVQGDADLVAGNIKKNVEIFGVTGTFEGQSIETQEKSATPGAQAVEVTPDAGKYLSKVIVQGDANLVASNIKKDVNVFGVTGTYEGTETNFLSFIENDTGMIVLPEGLTSVRQSCFKADSHQFTLPESLEAIGSYAFSGCTGMTSLSIPAGVKTIDTYAFNGCKNIEGSITIPAGVNEIAGASWYGCNKITEFIIKASFTAALYNRIQAYAFYNCSACLRYDFTAAEAVPELVNINAFNNHNADLRIIVPDALYEEWIATTNWSNSNISEHIIKESEEV